MDKQEITFVYLIFDVYEQVCGAYYVQAMQHDANREKLVVESLHCRIVDHCRRSPPRPSRRRRADIRVEKIN